MAEELIYVNGIGGATGTYLIPPMPLAEAAAIARCQPSEPWLAGWLRRIYDALRRPFLGLPLDVDPTDVSRAGWAVVFAADATPELRTAVEPLLAHRRTHVPPDRCKVLEYKHGESMTDWLRRHGVATGSVSPTRVPYYVTLVGDPTAIPFEFQYLLDIEYAVGRLAFDRPEQYRQYAESVVDYETGRAVPNAREVVYWGPRHDRATQLSADYLLTLLAQGTIATGGQPAEAAIAPALSYRS